MGDMQYSKKMIIKNKILKEDDVLRIAKLVHKQSHPDDYDEEYYVLFDDQSSIKTSKSIDVFKTDEFKRRRSERIWFIYRSKGLEKKIEIQLYNSLLSTQSSTMEISSTNREWYNSICNEISTILNEVEKQKLNITFEVKFWVPMIISLIEGLVLSFSLEQFFPNAFNNSQSSMAAALFTMIFMGINSWLFRLIEKAYPNMEFAFGPIYLNRSEKIRRSLGIFVPLVIDFVFFLLGLII